MIGFEGLRKDWVLCLLIVISVMSVGKIWSQEGREGRVEMK